MTLRTLSLQLVLFVVAWLPSTAALAAPPCPGTTIDECTSCLETLEALPAPRVHDSEALDELERAVNRLERAARNPDAATKAKIARLRDGTERLRARNTTLHFLSVAEVDRLQTVQAFDVIIDPIVDDSAAKSFADACAEIGPLVAEIPEQSDFDGTAILKGEVAGGDAATLTKRSTSFERPASRTLKRRLRQCRSRRCWWP
jgi:hypothetical protein